jgi:protein transport protein SEC24
MAEQQATGQQQPVPSAGPTFQPLTPGMTQPPTQQFGAMSLQSGPVSPSPLGPGAEPRRSGKLDVTTLPRPHLSDKISTYLTREMNLPPAATTLFTVDDRGSCSPKFMRSTLYQVPTTKEMMAQSQLPFSVVLQPFTDGALEQRDVPIVNMGDEGPLRCRRCRAYVNPFINFIDNGAQYQCRLCGCANEVPSEYFAPLDINGQRVDLAMRPELVHGTVDFVAPKDMQGKLLTPPPVTGTASQQQQQPASVQWVPSYVFVIDTSVAAVQSGLLAVRGTNVYPYMVMSQY